jgi:hypothetical protein
MVIHRTESANAATAAVKGCRFRWKIEPPWLAGCSGRMGYPPTLQPIASHDLTNASAGLPVDRSFAWIAFPGPIDQPRPARTTMTTRSARHTSNRSPCRLHWLAGGVLAATLSSASIASSPPNVSMTWQASGDVDTPINFDLASAGEWAEMDDGSVVYTGALFTDTWQLSWTTSVTDDSQTTLDTLLTITNTSADDQWFSAGTNYEAEIEDATNRIMEVASSVTLMNLAFGGSAMLQSLPNDSLIGSLLDDEQMAAVFSPVYALQANGPFAIAVDSADDSVFLAAGGATSLGQRADFMLTGGDTVTLHTITSISTIPAPGALTILALAATVGRSRRRTSRRGIQ